MGHFIRASCLCTGNIWKGKVWDDSLGWTRFCGSASRSLEVVKRLESWRCFLPFFFRRVQSVHFTPSPVLTKRRNWFWNCTFPKTAFVCSSLTMKWLSLPLSSIRRDLSFFILEHVNIRHHRVTCLNAAWNTFAVTPATFKNSLVAPVSRKAGVWQTAEGLTLSASVRSRKWHRSLNDWTKPEPLMSSFYRDYTA